MPRSPHLRVVPPDEPGVLSLDNLENLITGMGTAKDPRLANRFVFGERMSRAEAEAMYSKSWIGAKAVDAIAEDMVREWREHDGVEPEVSDEITEAEKKFGVPGKIFDALKWSRMYGGAGVVMLIDGAGEFHEELDPERVREGALKGLQVIDRWHLIPEGVEYLNPYSPTFGEPQFYRAYGGPDLIHRSRILLFHGATLPYGLAQRNHFWGLSILERVRDAIADAETTTQGVASLIPEAKVDVFKIDGLLSLVATEKGRQTLLKRFEMANLAKSIFNGLLLDTKEEYEQKTMALQTGLPQLVSQMLEVVAAAVGIPVTRFLEISPGGLNATGEEDTRNYYDKVAALQTAKLQPALEKLDEVLLRSEMGGVPDDYEFRFPTLWQDTDAEKAENQSKRATTDQAYFNMGVVEEHHIAARLVEEGLYPTMDDDWVAELKKRAEEEPDFELPPGLDPSQMRPGAPIPPTVGGGGNPPKPDSGPGPDDEEE